MNRIARIGVAAALAGLALAPAAARADDHFTAPVGAAQFMPAPDDPGVRIAGWRAPEEHDLELERAHYFEHHRDFRSRERYEREVARRRAMLRERAWREHERREHARW